MTDNEKIQTIKQWIEEAIRQGNNTVFVWAIKSILEEDCVIESRTGLIKLSEKSIKILEEKKKCQISSMRFVSLSFVYAEL